MVVQHNLQAMNTNRMLGITTSAQAKSTEKLSSGYRINRAADDAAGLTISEKMRKQIRGLTQASSNAQDGISCVQTAEGALTEVHSMLQRMNELSNQAANGTLSKDDRQNIQDELDQLGTEIDRVSETTKFNETYLLKGNGKSQTNTLAAHDAGFTGTLTANDDGKTSTFQMDALKVGDSIAIAGTDYTIGKSADSADYSKKGDTSVTPATVNDSVTSGGVTTTIVNKATVATATATGTWANGDTFTDADGKNWTVAATTDADAKTVKIADIGTYLKAGSSITKYAGGTTDALVGAKIVDDLGTNEISIKDTTGITALTNGIKVGDTVTVNGTSKTVTAETPKTLDEIKALAALDTAGTAVAIGSKTYTIGTATDESANKITKDDFLAKIKDGDKVTVGGTAYTAIVASDEAGVNKITVDKAYSLIADELAKASSIGTDTAATAKSDGNGKFTITQGTVETKEGLSVKLHVGADADSTNKITMDVASMSAAGLGIKGLDVTDETGTSATYAIDAISDAIKTVSSQRSALGAVQNRLEHTIANLDNVVENTTSAESAIRDVDMATEMVEYSKNNILAQAGQSMLAQANQSTQGVLSLLQ